MSSKMPREKGNIRLIGSRIVASGAKGGRNGKNSNRNVRVVTVARRIKSAVLISVRINKLGIMIECLPAIWSEINTFCNEI